MSSRRRHSPLEVLLLFGFLSSCTYSLGCVAAKKSAVVLALLGLLLSRASAYLHLLRTLCLFKQVLVSLALRFVCASRVGVLGEREPRRSDWRWFLSLGMM